MGQLEAWRDGVLIGFASGLNLSDIPISPDVGLGPFFVDIAGEELRSFDTVEEARDYVHERYGPIKWAPARFGTIGPEEPK